MKRKGFLQTAFTLTAMLLLAAACSQNDFDDKQGKHLPEGKYPMTFATTVEGVTATRATTADGQWTTGDKIAVQVDSEVKEYTATPVSGNAATATLSSTSPFYWQNTNDVSVSAWYCGTGYSATMPGTWNVQPDQNSNDGYQKSDFLYVPQTAIDFGGTKSLTFYHQTSKMVVNIRNAEALTDVSKIQSVSIDNVILSGNFQAPTAPSVYGLTVAPAGAKSQISANKLSSPNTGVNFESGSSTETALASYEALVIPQTITVDDKFININLSDGNTYSYKAVSGLNQLSAGQVHTYNITVKDNKLEVTVSSSGMTWTGNEENITAS